MIGRHVYLSYDDIVSVVEVLPNLLPDGFDSLAVGAPSGVELDEGRDAGVGHHGVEVVSNKYCYWSR